MKDQNLTDEDLVFFGPARFLKKNESCIFIIDCQSDFIEDKKRIYTDEALLIDFKQNEKFFGKFEITKKIVPYFSWILTRKIKSNNIINSTNLRVGRRETYTNRTSAVYIKNKLRLLRLGSIDLNRAVICGSKGAYNFESRILEFANFDYLALINCHSGSNVNLWFSSFEEVIIKNSHISFFGFYNTSLIGLSVEDSYLYNWLLHNSSICEFTEPFENISKSEFINSEFLNSNFFRFYEFLRLRDCKFEYNERASKNYGQIKIIYSSIGDFLNAGKYFYLERKSELFEKLNVLKFLRENKQKFPKSSIINKNIRLLIEKKKRSDLKIFERILFFLIIIIFLLTHYLIIGFDFINYCVRGFGEKPFRIIPSFVYFILIFSVLDYFFNSNQNFGTLMYNNLLNIFGKFDLESEDKFLSIIKVIKASFGFFLISLFVADFSSN